MSVPPLEAEAVAEGAVDTVADTGADGEDVWAAVDVAAELAETDGDSCGEALAGGAVWAALGACVAAGVDVQALNSIAMTAMTPRADR